MWFRATFAGVELILLLFWIHGTEAGESPREPAKAVQSAALAPLADTEAALDWQGSDIGGGQLSGSKTGGGKTLTVNGAGAGPRLSATLATPEPLRLHGVQKATILP